MHVCMDAWMCLTLTCGLACVQWCDWRLSKEKGAVCLC